MIEDEGFLFTNDYSDKKIVITPDNSIFADGLIEISRKLTNNSGNYHSFCNETEFGSTDETISTLGRLKKRRFIEGANYKIDVEECKKGNLKVKDSIYIDGVLNDRAADSRSDENGDTYISRSIKAKIFTETNFDFRGSNFCIFTKLPKIYFNYSSTDQITISSSSGIILPIVLTPIINSTKTNIGFCLLSLYDIVSALTIEASSSDIIDHYVQYKGNIKIKDTNFYGIVIINGATGITFEWDRGIYDSYKINSGELYVPSSEEIGSLTNIEIASLTPEAVIFSDSYELISNTSVENGMIGDSMLESFYTALTGRDYYGNEPTDINGVSINNITSSTPKEQLFPLFQNFRPEISFNETTGNIILLNYPELYFILKFYSIDPSAFQIGIIKKGSRSSNGNRPFYTDSGKDNRRDLNKKEALSANFSEVFVSCRELSTGEGAKHFEFNVNEDGSAEILNSYEFMDACVIHSARPARGAENIEIVRHRDSVYFQLIFKLNMNIISKEYSQANGRKGDPKTFRSWDAIQKQYNRNTLSYSYRLIKTTPRRVGGAYDDTSESKYYGSNTDLWENALQ